MADKLTTSVVFDQQALQLVVAQLLADQFSRATDRAAAHRSFTDRIHARIDTAEIPENGDFEALDIALLHNAVDLLMRVVGSTPDAATGTETPYVDSRR